MAILRVDVPYVIEDGSEVLFNPPCEFSKVTKLKVYYPNPQSLEETYESFTFCDANGNDVSTLENMFSNGALVKVILSVAEGRAFVQNAVTNSYIESKFKELEEKTLIVHSTSGDKYSLGMDDLGVYLELVGGDDTSSEEEIQTVATLILGDEDSGDYIEIDGERYNLSNIVEEETSLEEGTYDFDVL